MRIAALAISVALVLPVPASAYPRPGRTERVSVTADGSQGVGGDSWHAGISNDGRYVAFGSQAPLIPEDTNGVEDVYLRDRGTGELRRVSVAADGTQGNGTSYMGAMTPDGRSVAFTSHATTLVPGDTNGVTDVFVKDVATGEIERVSVSSGGTQTERRAFDPAISADGRYVVFISGSQTLDPPDTNGGCDTAVEGSSQGCDVFVHDRVTGETERVSEGSNGEQGNGPSGWRVDITADGRYVSFYSFSSNWHTDVNYYSDIFVKDRLTGNLEMVHMASDGTQADQGGALASVLSDDGRYVAFESITSNLVPADANTWEDVFVHDRETRITERISVSSTGTEGNQGSDVGDITPDGRYVLFSSVATNLVPGDTNASRDVFVHDRLTRATERVSVSDQGAQAGGHSFPSAFTSDARSVAFDSYATNLVPGDTNGASDNFVRDRGPGNGIGDLQVAAGPGSVQASGWASFDGVELARALDSPSDATPPGKEAGGELRSVAVVQRPEEGDLLLRVSVTRMGGVRGRYRVPGVPSPGVVYVVEFRIGSVRYEARATRVATTMPAGQPSIALHRCDPACALVGQLQGGIGTTGDEVLITVPLTQIPAAPGTTLEAVRALSGLGGADGIASSLDQAGTVDATLVGHGVSLGIAPAGAAQDDIAFGTQASVTDGAFEGALDTGSLAPGGYDVWARACVGTTCGSASRTVNL